MEYIFTESMAEISGFGGTYEQACQEMVIAGLKWIDENPEADPHYRGYKGIYGVLSDDNDDAKALTKVMIEASGNEATGAMHQATVSTVLWIKVHSWDEYVKEMSKDD